MIGQDCGCNRALRNFLVVKLQKGCLCSFRRAVTAGFTGCIAYLAAYN
jgi:hypothetical protein